MTLKLLNFHFDQVKDSKTFLKDSLIDLVIFISYKAFSLLNSSVACGQDSHFVMVRGLVVLSSCVTKFDFHGALLSWLIASFR